jgi:tetratricopeptide (TPR) repeat protein
VAEQPASGTQDSVRDRRIDLAAAVMAYRNGELEAAALACERQLGRDAQDFEVLLLLALIHYRAGRPQAALEHAERALGADASSADAWATRGLILRALAREAEALESYERALAIRPKFADALYNRGNLLQAAGRCEEALASYELALAQGDDAQTLNNRGVTLNRLERYQEALESFGRALRLRPRYPEALNNRGIALLALDFPERALDSFDRALDLDPRHAEACNNRGNALRAMQRLEEALHSYDRALQLKAAYAEAHSNRAAALNALGRHEDALSSADRALALRPGSVEALTHRATALLELQRCEDALAGFEQAYALSPDFTRLIGIGNGQQALGRHEQALRSFERALAMQPNHVGALSNRGNALRALGRHQEALQSYRQAIELKPGDAQAHWNQALTLLALGDLERGFEQYEWRWQLRTQTRPREVRELPVWLGREEVAGKTLLVYAEQGFGDAIQFIRYVPLLHARGARVLVACHRKLADLFRRVAGVERVLTPSESTAGVDYAVPLLSLPLAMKTRLETIPGQAPYLSADPTQAERWHSRVDAVGAGRKVGVVWRGNPDYPAARLRDCPLEQMAAVFGVPGCRFFNLQPDGAQALREGRVRVTDLAAEIDTFGDTAAAIQAMDLVITVDTAVAHLAGALNKPVWVLLAFAADWRWLLEREDSPWYPSARLFRQAQPGDWADVTARAAAALREAAPRRRRFPRQRE